MAAAGYDPSEASRFWMEMTKVTGRGGPEFLSTHPSHETRIHDLQQWASGEAMSVYERYPHAPHPDRPIFSGSPDNPPRVRKPKERPSTLKGKEYEFELQKGP